MRSYSFFSAECAPNDSLQGSSGRACGQLTSLLSSVQASLAELKVEVSSARKLNFDATLQKSVATSGCVLSSRNAPTLQLRNAVHIKYSHNIVGQSVIHICKQHSC